MIKKYTIVLTAASLTLASCLGGNGDITPNEEATKHAIELSVAQNDARLLAVAIDKAIKANDRIKLDSLAVVAGEHIKNLSSQGKNESLAAYCIKLKEFIAINNSELTRLATRSFTSLKNTLAEFKDEDVDKLMANAEKAYQEIQSNILTQAERESALKQQEQDEKEKAEAEKRAADEFAKASDNKDSNPTTSTPVVSTPVTTDQPVVSDQPATPVENINNTEPIQQEVHEDVPTATPVQ